MPNRRSPQVVREWHRPPGLRGDRTAARSRTCALGLSALLACSTFASLAHGQGGFLMQELDRRQDELIQELRERQRRGDDREADRRVLERRDVDRVDDRRRDERRAIERREQIDEELRRERLRRP